MRVFLSEADPGSLGADAVAVPVAGDERPELPATATGDQGVREALRQVATSNSHRGEIGEILPLHLQRERGSLRLLVYGIGKTAELDGSRLRNSHQLMIAAARKLGSKRLAVWAAPPLAATELSGIVEGCVMGTWDQGSRRTDGQKPAALEELTILGLGGGHESEVEAAVQLARASNRARELQNTPANELTPSRLADEARLIAERLGLELEILGPDELRAKQYNLLLGVASGSSEEPRLIRLRHRGAENGPRLAVVGKGITFDTGGISLKEAKNMQLMKGDMAGAAAVLCALEVIAARRVPADVSAVIPATENMPGSSALRPGDVIGGDGTKTVEVVNTDAEGRLVLGDAITHAIRSGATHIVDLATLTGAAKIVLGHVATAAVANDEKLWDLVAAAADAAGERVWRLPAYPDYKTLLRSSIADLRNSDYGEAGTIMGALFIREFVQGHPWVHLDIAASAWNDNSELSTVPTGPSGAGTRLVVRLAELIAQQPR